jgi:DNA topoisomerase-1
VLTGRFGPYVQVGETPTGKGSKSKNKPRAHQYPKEKDPEDVTLEEALKYLSLPARWVLIQTLAKEIVANIGRFGPYIAHNTKPKPDFRSLKTDDVYAIDLPAPSRS